MAETQTLTQTPTFVGVFHAITTRDWTATQRDGQPFVEVNTLDADTLEIQFADGEWMLAGPADVTLS